MDQEQINVIGTEGMERATEGPAANIRPMKPVVELAGEVNLAAVQPRIRDRIAHFALIAVHLRGVDWRD